MLSLKVAAVTIMKIRRVIIVVTEDGCFKVHIEIVSEERVLVLGQVEVGDES